MISVLNDIRQSNPEKRKTEKRRKIDLEPGKSVLVPDLPSSSNVSILSTNNMASEELNTEEQDNQGENVHTEERNAVSISSLHFIVGD